FLFPPPCTTHSATLSLHDALPISRRLTIIALAAALAAGLAASGRPALGQGGPIRIGAVFAVTGPAGSLGKPEKDTAAMLQEQLRSEEHTSELQSPYDLVCRLLLEK